MAPNHIFKGIGLPGSVESIEEAILLELPTESLTSLMLADLAGLMAEKRKQGVEVNISYLSRLILMVSAGEMDRKSITALHYCRPLFFSLNITEIEEKFDAVVDAMRFEGYRVLSIVQFTWSLGNAIDGEGTADPVN